MPFDPKNIKAPQPVLAIVGAGDHAVRKLREVRLPDTDIATLRAQLQNQLQARVKAAQTQVATTREQVRTAPDRTQTAVTGAFNDAVAQANSVYGGLTARGRSLVTRIRRQQATQDLQDAASTTVTQGKATTTTAKKAAKSTRTRAKATTTSARKTASAAGKAAKDAADKVGD